MDIGMAILMLVFGMGAGALIMASIFESKDGNNGASTLWGSMAVVCLFMIVVFVCMGINIERNKPVETKEQPQIDTLITIKNGVSDTTYYYNFENKKSTVEP